MLLSRCARLLPMLIIRAPLRMVLQEARPAASEGFTASLPAIDECFRYDSVEEIYAALEARGGDWAQQTLKQLKA